MRYLIRRVVSLFLTLFLVSLLTFLAFNVIPGDPVTLILGTDASPERAAVLRTRLDLDKPLPVRYLGWLSGIFQGDFGNSIKYSVPVRELVTARLPVTAWLGLLSILLIIVIAIPTGIYCARKRNTLIDRFLNTASMVNLAIPNFFLGIVFIWVFGLQLKLFLPGGYIDYRENFSGFIGYLIFPAVVIALPNIAILVKFIRAAVLGQLQADYIKTAYSKGLDHNEVIYRHVLKNSFLPVITLLGMIFAEILAGSIIIEQVFGLPGLGRLLITSISFRDFPLIETMILYFAFTVVMVNFGVDILLQLLDPRIRVQ